MLRSALVSAVPAVDWRQLRSTYESGAEAKIPQARRSRSRQPGRRVRATVTQNGSPACKVPPETLHSAWWIVSPTGVRAASMMLAATELARGRPRLTGGVVSNSLRSWYEACGWVQQHATWLLHPAGRCEVGVPDS